MIETFCPDCRKFYHLKDDLVGKTVKCKCGSSFLVHPPRDMLSEDDAPPPPRQAEDGAAGKSEFWRKGMGEQLLEDQFGKKITARVFITGGFLIAVIAGLGFCIELWYGTFKAKAAFMDGEAAAASNDWNKAMDKFEMCIQLKPKWAAPYLYAGYISYQKGQFGEAERYCREMVDIRKDNRSRFIGLTNLAALSMAREKPDLDSAERYLQEVMGEVSEHPHAILLKALLKYEKGQMSEIDPLLKKLYLSMITEPQQQKEATVIYSVVRTYLGFATKDLRSVVGHSSILLNGEWAKLYRGMGMLMLLSLAADMDNLNINDSEQRKIYDLVRGVRVEDLEPKYKDFARMAAANMELNVGNNQSAIAMREARIAEGKADAAERYELLKLLRVTRDKENDINGKRVLDHKMKALFDGLLKDDAFVTGKGVGLIVLAMEHNDFMENRQESLQILDRGLSLFPNDSRLQRRKGVLLFRDGKYVEGLAYLEKSLKLNPSQDDLKEDLGRYRAAPVFADFMPVKPKDCVARPLIHLRIESGSPMPVTNVLFKLDGQEITMKKGGDEYFYLPGADLQEGIHSLSVTAEDGIGNRKEEQFSFPSDKTPPVIKLVAPSSPMRDSQPEFRLKLEDKVSGVAAESVQLLIVSAAETTEKIRMLVINSGSYCISDPANRISVGVRLASSSDIVFRVPRPLKPGLYKFEAKLADAVGNETKMDLPFAVVE